MRWASGRILLLAGTVCTYAAMRKSVGVKGGQEQGCRPTSERSSFRPEYFEELGLGMQMRLGSIA